MVFLNLGDDCHGMVSQEDSVGNVEASIVVCIPLEAQAGADVCPVLAHIGGRQNMSVTKLPGATVS